MSLLGKLPANIFLWGGWVKVSDGFDAKHQSKVHTWGMGGQMVIAVQSPQWSATTYESLISQGEGFGCQGGYGWTAMNQSISQGYPYLLEVALAPPSFEEYASKSGSARWIKF